MGFMGVRHRCLVSMGQKVEFIGGCIGRLAGVGGSGSTLGHVRSRKGRGKQALQTLLTMVTD